MPIGPEELTHFLTATKDVVVSMAPELCDWNRCFVSDKALAAGDLAMENVSVSNDCWHQVIAYTATNLKEEHACGIAIALMNAM